MAVCASVVDVVEPPRVTVPLEGVAVADADCAAPPGPEGSSDPPEQATKSAAARETAVIIE